MTNTSVISENEAIAYIDRFARVGCDVELSLQNTQINVKITFPNGSVKESLGETIEEAVERAYEHDFPWSLV